MRITVVQHGLTWHIGRQENPMALYCGKSLRVTPDTLHQTIDVGMLEGIGKVCRTCLGRHHANQRRRNDDGSTSTADT